MIARTRKRRGQWFWRFRKDGPPAVAEQRDDGQWDIFIRDRLVGTVGTRAAVERVIAKLDGEEDRGRR